MVRVAEGASEIASAEPYEYCRRAGVKPFSLERIENFVDLHGGVVNGFSARGASAWRETSESEMFKAGSDVCGNVSF